MVTVADIIRSGLRLINVPGRGSQLSNDDLSDGLDRLVDIINSAAVSKFFIPGVRRHFFALSANTDIYSYGPGGDFDTNRFGDPVPVKVEDGYIREGATITDNEQVTNGDFTLGTGWTLGAQWTIANGKLTVGTGGTGVASQSLSLSAGTTYTVSVTVTQRASSVVMRVLQDATPVVSQTLDAQGTFTFTFTISGGSAWSIDFTANATSDLDIDDVSIIESSKDRFELSRGSDYQLLFVDQTAYNRRFTKGTGGRPYELFFSRAYPLAEVRFDNSAIPGDIIVMDVLVNSTSISSTDEELRLYPEAMKWLKYRLAYEIAPQYGAAVSAQHLSIMREAYNDMAAGTRRVNQLRVDRALRQRPTFDINRGDP